DAAGKDNPGCAHELVARDSSICRRPCMKEKRKHTRLAIWLLLHFGLRTNRVELAGDLVEQIEAGRSEGWLWREVVYAVTIGFVVRLRERWLELCFAVLGTFLIANGFAGFFAGFQVGNHPSLGQ